MSVCLQIASTSLSTKLGFCDYNRNTDQVSFSRSSHLAFSPHNEIASGGDLVGDRRWFTGQNSLLSGFCHDTLLQLAALCSRYCRGVWSYSWRLVRRFGSSPSRTSRKTPKQETPMKSRSSSAASCSLQIQSKVQPSRRSTSSWIHLLKSSDFSSCLYTARKYLWNKSVYPSGNVISFHHVVVWMQSKNKVYYWLKMFCILKVWLVTDFTHWLCFYK